jgi:hypothetical protein
VAQEAQEAEGETMRIDVTQDDITYGKRRAGDRCPIAIAIMRALNEPIVEVSFFKVFIPDGSRYSMPAAARVFINDFDGGLFVQPFSFELVELCKST